MDILITGGTGSFGRAYVRYLLEKGDYDRIVIYSRSEYLHWCMRQENDDPRLRFFLGDVRDRDRLRLALSGVSHVVHAAALKQVDALEYNPSEAVRTNVLGADNLIHACNEAGVERCVALSTDKAVSPCNLYGATKATMERMMIAANMYDGCRFSCTRYGNVWGSRGSIVERLLHCQPEDTIYITDPTMTRFFMRLEHAVSFVACALGTMRGGEVFVPILPSVRLGDLIDSLCPENPKEVIGARPGEKWHEAMVSPEEGRRAIYDEENGRIVVFPSVDLPVDRAQVYDGGASVAYTSADKTLLGDAARDFMATMKLNTER